MADQLEAEFLRNALLQALDFLVAELDDVAGLDIDEMIVVLARGFLEAHTASTEVVARNDSLAGQKTNGAIDGGERNAGIDGTHASINFIHVGVIGSFRKNAGNHATRRRHAQAVLGAKPLDSAGLFTSHFGNAHLSAPDVA